MPSIRDLTKEQLANGEAVELISKQFMPALNAQLQTAAGQYERLINIVGSRYVEAIGQSVTDSRAFQQGLKALGDTLAALAPDVAELRDFIEKTVIALGQATQSVMGFGSTVTNFIGGLIAGIAELGSMIVAAISAPLKTGIELAGSLSSFIGLPAGVEQAFRDANTTIENMNKAIEKTGMDVADFFNNTADGMKTFELGAQRVVGAMQRAEEQAKKTNKSYKKQSDALKDIAKAETERAKTAELANKKMAAMAAEAEQAYQAQIKAANMAKEAARARAAQIINPKMLNLQRDALLAGQNRAAAVGEAQAAGAGAGGIGEFASMGLGFLGSFIDTLIDGFKNPEIIEKMIEGITTALENLMNPAVLNRVVNSVVGLAVSLFDTLGKPGFISNIVKAVIRAVIRTVAEIIPRLPAIGLEIIRAIIEGFWTAIKEFGTALKNFFKRLIDFITGRGGGRKATETGAGTMFEKMETDVERQAGVVQAFAAASKAPESAVNFQQLKDTALFVGERGSEEMIRTFLAGFESITEAGQFSETELRDIARSFRQGLAQSIVFAGGKGMATAKGMSEITEDHIISQFMHRGGIVGANMRGRDVPIMAQGGEAVIPNAPRSFQGLQTDASGNVRGAGGGAVHVTINAMDSMSFKDFMKRSGMEVINNIVRNGVTDQRGRRFATG